jgi:hypothetical protein
MPDSIALESCQLSAFSDQLLASCGCGDSRFAIPRREAEAARSRLHQTPQEKKMINPRRKERDETGSDAAGQSGDIQQTADRPYADSESVEELVEEGNAFEAGIVSGVENAPDPDVAEVRTREVPEDDVPAEYLDNEP